MQNEFTVMNPSSVGERKADTQPINDEMNQVRSTVEQTRHSIKVARRELDEHVEKSRFGVRVLWAVVILLAAPRGVLGRKAGAVLLAAYPLFVLGAVLF